VILIPHQSNKIKRIAREEAKDVKEEKMISKREVKAHEK